MDQREATEYLVECFWPGVAEGDLADLDRRAEASADELSVGGQAVRYLGSLLVRQDEVVFCRFEGSEAMVRGAAEQAAIPFERIVEAGRSPWASEQAHRRNCPPGELEESSTLTKGKK